MASVCLLAVASLHALASAPALPRAVRPFPAGLSGTIAFESDVAGRPGIYLLDLATGTVRRATGHPGLTERTPRWAPDGRRLAFSSNRAHYEGDARDTGTPDLDVWAVNADGSGASRLTTDPANESDPAWTADGARIVYSSDRDSRGDLYELTLGGGRVVRLTRHFVGRAIMPSVSTAPERVAFAAQTLRVGAFWDFQVHVRGPGGSVTAVPADTGACWPRWSPDGRRLAHVRLEGEQPSALEIRRGDTFASSAVLRADGLWSYYPAWSPDQARLAFSVSPAHHEGEDWDLAVVDLATGRWTRLTEGPGNDRLPDWTDAGGTVARAGDPE
ncbi:MAG: hypothetical protein R2745_13495 [Vicinamibacterales bacterium]